MWVVGKTGTAVKDVHAVSGLSPSMELPSHFNRPFCHSKSLPITNLQLGCVRRQDGSYLW